MELSRRIPWSFVGRKLAAGCPFPSFLASFGHAHPRGSDWRQIATTSEGVSFTHFAKKVSLFVTSGLLREKSTKHTLPRLLHLLAQRPTSSDFTHAKYSKYVTEKCLFCRTFLISKQ